ncbi:HD-GYP domain-containing protein [Halanaerobacter jeridensis]|uniref:HD-GYP domain-containing protein (C-di-GMP phosphodiesterase class II) n=1 Tax=Halanaerobacter jeridensis TaxID=706427 RepID=A0A939BQA0_9FIRM|nr:HD domain-containing phosphohydrolase [Halanaerobacter jeridensis]MBM7557888.1 HD-GYP domain-containing protein (c-di-GMP phosphodiesterase class II) [Halanaerobacter jeridensis]
MTDETDRLEISLFDLILSISHNLDLIYQDLEWHHEKVAYITYEIVSELNYTEQEKKTLIMAAALHDIGILNLEHKKIDVIEEVELNGEEKIVEHAKVGAVLINKFQELFGFEGMENLVQYHHAHWDNGESNTYQGRKDRFGSHILHLADRVAILTKGDNYVLNQKDEIMNKIKSNSGSIFAPRLVEILERFAERESFWLTLDTPKIIEKKLKKNRKVDLNVKLDIEQLLEVSKFFSQIIDLRSRFTFVHSQGVAAVSSKLAEKLSWSEREVKKIKIAGYLHDLGKLTTPKEILDKPGKLTAEEYKIIQSHTFHTYHSLDMLGLTEIRNWAAFHHERLDGTGYPFKIGELSTGSRIMAVADVFTAITENRPYRSGMKKKKAISVLESMAADDKLDRELVNIVVNNYQEFNSLRDDIQIKHSTEDKFIV